MNEIQPDRYYLGFWYFPYAGVSTGDLLLCASRRLTEPLDWELEFRFRRSMNCKEYCAIPPRKTEEELEAQINAMFKALEVRAKERFKVAAAPFEFWPARCEGTAFADTIARNPPRFFVYEFLPDGRVTAITPLIR